ncbi:NnrS family protein [Vreelandella populi]|uniref:NnrS family protein n=1 Tax=Vreelandella populi TaxID=2498858 RepID=UPI000F8DCAFB|nr:hypothetical protein ELY40_14380 [Halomonas populi]
MNNITHEPENKRFVLRLVAQGLPWRTSLHLLTVGALGTLSITMMLKVTWQRTRKHRPPAGLLWGCALLIFSATGLRTLWPEHNLVWLWLASLCWPLAYLICGFSCTILKAKMPSRSNNTPHSP